MTTLNQHLEAYPRGRRYSYAVRIRGLPYLYTDGRVNWNTYAQTYMSTTAVPFLAKTDWSFKFESNPLEPLAVGSGISVELLNDAGGLVRNLFAPMREPDFTLTLDEVSLGTNTTTFDVLSATGVSQGTKLYWGLETMNVVSVATNTLTVERAYFASQSRRYQEINTGSDLVPSEGVAGLLPMYPLLSHPDIWRGRYVDVLMGVIEDDETLGDVFPVWAGRVDSFSLDGPTVKISVDPLTASITKDNWPRPMPKGSLQGDTTRIHIRDEDMFIIMSTNAGAASSVTDAGTKVPIIDRDTTIPPVLTLAGVGTGGQWVTLERLAQWLQDTIIYGLQAAISVPASNYDLFSVAVADRGGDDFGKYQVFVAKNETNVHVTLDAGRGLLGRIYAFISGSFGFNTGGIGTYWHIAARETTEFGMFLAGSGFTLDRVFDKLVCFLDHESRPFDENRGGCYSTVDSAMRGFLRVSQGDNVELIAISGGAVASDGTYVADITNRGLGGTAARDWGSGEDPINVEQILAVQVGDSMALSDLLLYLLTSSCADAAIGENGNYDFLGEWAGLGIPVDLVDVEGIISKLSASDLPRPTLFWITEPGKGKEAIEDLLKANAVYLVTKRFTRDGVEHFGISVDVVDVPVTSRYQSEFTDADVVAGKRPQVNVNERLLINVVSLAPHYRFGTDAGDTGGMRYAYAERSIAKYGQAKTLELEPNSYYSTFDSLFGGYYYRPEKVTVAIVASISARWFGAYSNGNYTLESDTPHIGWKFQAGDRVLVTLTGASNPNGTNSFDGLAAKVVDVTHKHGTGAGARVVLRISVFSGCELAPNFSVASIAGSTITLSDSGVIPTVLGASPNPWSWLLHRANVYSTDEFEGKANPIPPFPDDTGAATDAMWFEPTRHADNGGLVIRIWDRGDYENYEEFTVVSRAGNVLTLSGSPTLTTGTTKRIIGTFADYDNPSTLRSTYAHLASNAATPLLGGTDKAKRWL